MSRIDTKITQFLDIQTPIISAPMAGASGGALASQVTAAGGFGFLSADRCSPEKFKHELSLAQSLLKPDSSQSNQPRLPIGVGCLGWLLEKPDSISVELLSTALENNVKAVWFACGEDLGRWVQFVRDFDDKAKKGSESKTIVFVQISTVEEALVAVNDWKVDVLVAQGIESGGHGSSSAPPLHTLIPSILAALPTHSIPLLGAGGISNGSDIASLLTLGASGAVLGTRFLLTPESIYTDLQKQLLLSAKQDSTVRSFEFDRARGTVGWPQGIDGRGLRNKIVDDADKGVDIEEVKTKVSEGGHPDYTLVWAGTGVGQMTKVQPAADIVHELHREIEQQLKISPGM